MPIKINCWKVLLVILLLGIQSTVLAYQPPTALLPKQEKTEDEIGLYDIPMYISDLQTVWQYGSVYYNHINKYGTFGATVNFYYKFNYTAEQYQLQAYPKISDKIYLDLEVAYAKRNQFNFPGIQYLAQIYITEGSFEYSLGQANRIFTMFEYQKFNDYIGQIGYYFGNYFAWARIDHVNPQAVNLYSVGITKYIDGRYVLVTLNANIGKILDIGDLPPLDQKIIANQKGVNLYVQYYIAESLYFRAGVGYLLLNYKSIGLTRGISDVVAGLLWRF